MGDIKGGDAQPFLKARSSSRMLSAAWRPSWYRGSSNNSTLGSNDHGAGQGHPLLLSAGQLGGVFLLQALQTEAAQLLRCLTLLFRAAAVRIPHWMFWDTVMLGNRAYC